MAGRHPQPDPSITAKSSAAIKAKQQDLRDAHKAEQATSKKVGKKNG